MRDPADPARARAVLGRDRARHPRPAGRLGGRGRARHLLRPGRAVVAAAPARSPAPALVVGHPADPIHPAADAAMLADEMPNARVRAGAQHPGVAGARPSGSTARPPSSPWRCWAGAAPGTPRGRLTARPDPRGQNGRVPLYRDEAIVLRTHKLGEADRIITLLTRQHGRGPRGRQGRTPDDVAVRLAARAVHPRRPAARRGPQPRRDHPGRDPHAVLGAGSARTTTATPPAP